MKIRLRIILVGIAASAALASAASAQPSSAPDKAEAASNTTPFAPAKAATDEVLEKATAREDLSQAANTTQTSTVTGNSVSGTSTTGGVGFNDNAFQNASGLTVINANSGNNVSMNASMNVNIVMVPAGPQL